jgi:hypothetical protein
MKLEKLKRTPQVYSLDMPDALAEWDALLAGRNPALNYMLERVGFEGIARCYRCGTMLVREEDREAVTAILPSGVTTYRLACPNEACNLWFLGVVDGMNGYEFGCYVRERLGYPQLPSKGDTST